MKHFFFFLFLLLNAGWSHAQTTPVQKFSKLFEYGEDYSGQKKNTVNRDLYTDSSGIYFFGNVSNFTQLYQATLVSKFNYDGTLQWKKVWRSSGLLNAVYGSDCVVKQENGFTIVGVDANPYIRDSMFLYNPFLLTIDKNGDSIRLVKHEEDSVHDRELFGACAGSGNSVYAIGYWGSEERVYEPSERILRPLSMSLYVVKYDDTGAIVWEKKFWPMGLFEGNPPSPSQIARASNGDLYICGRAYDSSLNTHYGNYYLKLDSNGNELWRKSYKYSSYEFFGNQQVLPTSDGGFYYAYTGMTIPVLGGNGLPPNDVFCYGRCNANGDTLWTRFYADTGQIGGYKSSYVMSLSFGKPGELLLTGRVYYTSSDLSGINFHPTLLILDTTGNIKYKREYFPYPYESFERIILHTTVTPYNTLVFSGILATNQILPGVVDTPGVFGWLMQTDSTGCLTDGCIPEGVALPASTLTEVQLYPNPTAGTFFLKNLPASGCQYLILDATGRTLRRGTLSQTQEALHIEDLPAGLYLLQLRDSKGAVQAFKVMKE